MAKHTGSGKIIDLQRISLAQDYMNIVSSKGNWTEMKFALVITPLISLVKDQTLQLRDDAIFLFAESWKTKATDLFSVQLNQFCAFTEISSCSKDSKKDCAALLLTRLTAF